MPGEQMKCCSNSGWLLWQPNEDALYGHSVVKAAELSIADLVSYQNKKKTMVSNTLERLWLTTPLLHSIASHLPYFFHFYSPTLLPPASFPGSHPPPPRKRRGCPPPP